MAFARRFNGFKAWLTVIVLFVSTQLQLGIASAAESTTNFAPTTFSSDNTGQEIERLTKEILLTEIELERFNIHYRQEVAKQGRWKGWRYFLSQEANSAATDAGLIVGIKERMSKIHNALLVNPHTIQHGLVPQAVGQIIGASGSTLELLINEYHEYQAKRQGFSPKMALEHVLELKSKMDRLLSQRDALIAVAQSSSILHSYAPLAIAEGQVLRDIKDLTLAEYAKFHIGARRFLAFQQSLYLLDIAKNTTGAIGNLVAKHSVHIKNRHLNGPAGILTTVSGALIILTPLLSRTTGILVGAYHKRSISKCSQDILTKEVSKLDADTIYMQRLSQEKSTDVSAELLEHQEARLSVYEGHTQSFLKQLNLSTREVRAGNLAATENIASGIFTGGTKVSAGVTTTVAGYKYFSNAKAVNKFNATVTNSLIGAGTISYCVGTSWALLDNPRIQFKREWVNHNLSKQHLLPGQILKARLKQLEEMEASLARLKS